MQAFGVLVSMVKSLFSISVFRECFGRIVLVRILDLTGEPCHTIDCLIAKPQCVLEDVFFYAFCQFCLSGDCCCG